MRTHRAGREMLGIADNVPLIFAVGRLVKKKGFEYLIDATAVLKTQYPHLRVAIAGDGDLEAALRSRAQTQGVGGMVHFLGVVSHDVVPTMLAAADVAVAPSVHDDAGNVDACRIRSWNHGVRHAARHHTAGGISAVATDGVTARLVPEATCVLSHGRLTRSARSSGGPRTGGPQARDSRVPPPSWRACRGFEAVYEVAKRRGANGPRLRQRLRASRASRGTQAERPERVLGPASKERC